MAYILDKADARILFELDKNARIPDTKLAKLLKKSKESVRYRIKKLQDQGIIQGYSIWIDPTKLGYTSGKVYLNLANKPEKKKEFIEYVTKDKRLFWLGIGEGAWNAGMTFFLRTNREFFDLKNELFAKFQDLILDSHTAVIIEVAVCDKTFFYEADTTWTSLFSKRENHSLEPIEVCTLKELFLNGRVNVVDIARKYNVSVDIIRNRMRRLEKNGIIKLYNARIDYTKLGYEFFKTFLYFKSLSKKDETKLMEYARVHPKIIHVVKQISPWDIELEIMCESYLDYNSIIDKLTKEFSDTVSKVETAIMSENYLFPAKEMIFE